MTKFFVLLFALVFAPHAYSSICTSNDFLQGGTVTLFCTNGNCNGTIPGESLDVSGNCSDGTTFQSSGILNSTFITGFCTGTIFNADVPASFVELQGTCSNKTNFTGTATVAGGFINGICNPNGISTLFLPSTSVSTSGSCQ